MAPEIWCIEGEERAQDQCEIKQRARQAGKGRLTAPQDPQVLVPSLAVPHLGQSAPCMFAVDFLVLTDLGLFYRVGRKLETQLAGEFDLCLCGLGYAVLWARLELRGWN